jgi:4-hydroxy-tetrahydrodipicolinate reductase
MNPGPTQILGVVNSANVADIENVTVIESVDGSCHHSAETWNNWGYGLPIEDPRIPRMLEKGTSVFGDGVYLMADCFGVEIIDAPPPMTNTAFDDGAEVRIKSSWTRYLGFP